MMGEGAGREIGEEGRQGREREWGGVNEVCCVGEDRVGCERVEKFFNSFSSFVNGVWEGGEVFSFLQFPRAFILHAFVHPFIQIQIKCLS